MTSEPEGMATERLPWTQRLGLWWARVRAGTPPDPEAEARKAREIDALIEDVAKWVVGRRLETPAVLFLETHKPLSFLASQSVLVGTPLLAPLLGLERMEQYHLLLEKSENVDRLIDRIEELSEAR